MLKINNVSKTFNPHTINQKVVFNNFNLEIDTGDFITILGSNGAGKSTLFNLICGKFLPDHGQILLNDLDITYLPDYKRSKYIGHIFQDPTLGTCPDLSILENLSLAYLQANKRTNLSFLKKSDKEFLTKKLKQINLDLDTRLDTPVKLLSGGQRQALTLIMATLVTPELLLLDEHTAALDPNTSNLIMTLTNDIIHEFKITSLMITHNINDALKYGNKTLILNNGKIVKILTQQEKKNISKQELLDLYYL